MARAEEKLPIFDEEAERQVIGALALEPSYLGQVNLDPADFYHGDLRHLFEIILSLQQRGEDIKPETVQKELETKAEDWALTMALSEALPLDCLAQAEKVKEMSRQRFLAGTTEKALRDFRRDHLTSTELADRLRLALDSLTLPSRTSRMIIVSDPRIVQAESPTYKFTVSSINGKNPVEVRISSAELDKPSSFRRHIREKLRINPLLPKQYDEFIHKIVQQAVVESEQEDASTTETTCYWIREWFSSANEAENVEDLNQGYVKKGGARWFSAERLLRYLAGHAGLKLTRSQLWEAIHDRGGQKSRNIRLGDSVLKLWGINEQFFASDKIAEGDQASMDEDLSWLEEG